jgi:hypothetical protein
MDEKTLSDRLDQILGNLPRDVGRSLVMATMESLVDDMVKDPAKTPMMAKINAYAMLTAIEVGLASASEPQAIVQGWCVQLHDLILAELRAAGLAE